MCFTFALLSSMFKVGIDGVNSNLATAIRAMAAAAIDYRFCIFGYTKPVKKDCNQRVERGEIPWIFSACSTSSAV